MIPTPAAEMGWAAPRPGVVALASRRGRMMPDLDDAITRFADVVAGMRAPALHRTKAPPRNLLADDSRSFAPVVDL